MCWEASCCCRVLSGHRLNTFSNPPSHLQHTHIYTHIYTIRTRPWKYLTFLPLFCLLHSQEEIKEWADTEYSTGLQCWFRSLFFFFFFLKPSDTAPYLAHPIQRYWTVLLMRWGAQFIWMSHQPGWPVNLIEVKPHPIVKGALWLVLVPGPSLLPWPSIDPALSPGMWFSLTPWLKFPAHVSWIPWVSSLLFHLL